MDDYQKIKIEDDEYFIVDSIQDLRVEDSFVRPKNKLKAHGASGEARKYVGSYLDESGDRLSKFFEYDKWGDINQDGDRTYLSVQRNNCFISKSNLAKYLSDAKIEYEKQEQVYRFDISTFHEKYLDEVEKLELENNFFSIHDVSDLIASRRYRAYIRSKDSIWTLLRKLVLPKVSYLSILKLVPVNASKKLQSPLFLFRVLLDYQFRSIVHPQLLAKPSAKPAGQPKVEPSRPSKARLGQEKYRREVIDLMAQCPFTKVSDERLLIASHIKPYSVCIKENKKRQALDCYNGLALTPTYDKLFDQGYITFTDEGELICGTLLSPYTWDKLNINPNAKNKMKIFPERREEYLAFHRKFVFQN